MSPTTRATLLRWTRIVGVFLGALILQVVVMADLRVLGAMGDLMLVLAIAAGSAAGADRGLIYGFAAGMSYDFLLDTPLGMLALVYALIGLGAGAVSDWMGEQGPWHQVLVAAVASPLSVATVVGVARILGFVYPVGDVVRTGIVVTVWSCLFVLPVRRVVAWARRSRQTDDFWVALP